MNHPRWPDGTPVLIGQRVTTVTEAVSGVVDRIENGGAYVDGKGFYLPAELERTGGILTVHSPWNRFDPLPAGHSGIGVVCLGCGQALREGERPALVNGAPADPEEGDKAAAGKAHNQLVQLAHQACAFDAIERGTAVMS